MPNTGFLGWAYISGSTVSVAGGLSDKQVNFISGSTISGSDGLVYNYETNALSASNIISASAFYGDGSNLTGVSGGSGSPGGSDTYIQFNDASAFGGEADFTFDKATSTLALTGTLIATGSGAPGYIFSLSGSAIDSSYGAGVTGKYALVADDDILIDAGPSSNAEVSIISANGKVTIGAGGYGGAPTDVVGAASNLSGVNNTIASRDGAGIDVHSANTLSLSGSVVNITGNISAVNNLSASQNISASAFYGDGSNLSGVGGGGSPAGSDTYIQFNDGGSSFGGEADFTFDKTTSTLVLTGTLIATGSGSPGYIFSLSGSNITASLGGGALAAKYALVADDNVLIDLASVGGVFAVTAPAGALIAGMGDDGAGGVNDMLQVGAGVGSPAGTVNSITTYNNAGIDVHSENTLSLSGSDVQALGGSMLMEASAGNMDLLGATGVAISSNAGNVDLSGDTGISLLSNNGSVSLESMTSDVNLSGDTGIMLSSNNGSVFLESMTGDVSLVSDTMLSLNSMIDAVEITAGTTINLNSDVAAISNITASGHVSASTFYGDGSNLSGVGGGSPGGSDTYIQFNDASAFGGEANFTFNKTTVVFNVSGSTRITGALDQGNNTAENYFRLSSHADRLSIAEAFYSGETYYPKSGNPAVSTTAGSIYYLTSTDEQLAFTASVTTSGAEALPVLALGSSNTDGFLVRGWLRYQGAMSASISSSATDMEFEMAKQVYASSITPGYLTTVQPTGSGDVIRVMGNSVGSWQFYFNPSPDFVTV